MKEGTLNKDKEVLNSGFLGKTKYEKKEERRGREEAEWAKTQRRRRRRKRGDRVFKLNLGYSILFEGVEYIYIIFCSALF